jgi:hypothetical protein
MITILHVSDLHFGQSADQNRKAKALLDAIRPLPPNCYLLVTGDFTQSGTPGEYGRAGEALSPFAGRVLVTPGNHDYGTSWFGTGYSPEKAKYFDDPFAKDLGFKHHFFDKKVFVMTLEDRSDNSTLMMIGLNSCAKAGFSAEGEVGRPQRDELRCILDGSNPHVPKLLFLHHVPTANLGAGMTLRDREELMAVVDGKVDVLAFGHHGVVMQPDQRGKSIRLLPAPPRPMRSRRVVVGTKRVWVLDADSSVAEQACYLITSDGKKTTAAVKRFGKRRVIRKRPTARADRRHV